ncbi:hypothetical protein CapIbe_010099 [Capra ibex]
MAKSSQAHLGPGWERLEEENGSCSGHWESPCAKPSISPGSDNAKPMQKIFKPHLGSTHDHRLCAAGAEPIQRTGDCSSLGPSGTGFCKQRCCEQKGARIFLRILHAGFHSGCANL